MSDTIAAIATGLQRSAIGIIRLSGDAAIDIADKVFFPAKGGRLSDCKPHSMVLGELRSPRGELLDNCLAVISPAPGSYTGEDCAELQCHGSPAVLSAALTALFSLGARQALAGEFTKRAFLNGRLDLTQAEAVVDLIDAETRQSAVNAAAQLGGAVSRKTDRVYNALLESVSHFQAIIDYPDDEIEPFENARLHDTLSFSLSQLKGLLDSFGRGQIIKDGIKCAIIGKPNVGKSSLLNALLGYDRAIVTDRAGTTRDTIEESLVVGGTLLRLSDTAGLRDTGDEAEEQGVERALRAAAGASLVIAVFDGSEPFSEEDGRVCRAAASAGHRIALINKCDLRSAFSEADISSQFDEVLRISALNGEGLSGLDAFIEKTFDGGEEVNGEVITNARQYDAILRAYEAIERASAALENGITADAVLSDAEQAMAALGELSGKIIKDDIIYSIFSRFCVGK